MKLSSIALALVLAPFWQPVFAQQTATKPVLSATPPAATEPAMARPAAPAAEPLANHPAEVSASYIIGPEDSLQVNVWKEPGLSGTFPVRPDGMISLSLVGDLPAAGFTPMQLGSDITTRLKKFITDPSVTVTVLSVHPKQIFLLGEVARVGAIPITPEMTPLQAISTAGGLSPYANAKRIYILRGEQGKQKKIPFDYKKAIKDGNQQGIVLLPGDTIVVP